MPRAQLDPSNQEHQHILARLEHDEMIWLASVRPDGRPHLVPVGFLWEEQGTILVFSQPNQKVRNLREHPTVTLALDGANDGHDVVIIEGEAALLAAGEATPEHPRYAQKYARHFARVDWTPTQMKVTYSQAIRITPTRFFSNRVAG